MFNLSGRVAVVTGAARGIGQAIAIELAEHGAIVVVSDISDCKETIEKIRKKKGQCFFFKADVSSEKQVMGLFKDAFKYRKRIDILVNNAGIYLPSQTIKETEKNFEKTININLKGYFLCAREALKIMTKRKSGSIVNIASVAGLRGYANSAAYCASKGAIIAMTKALAVEYGNQKIRVNSICPGLIATGMTKAVNKKQMLSKIPLHRIGTPEDIAEAALYLASNASSYVTGHALVVDGGWTCGL